MDHIRAFIAAQLPATIQRHLTDVSGSLAHQLPPQTVRWVKPENMHLTLRFLRDMPASRLPQLQLMMDTICRRHQPFTLTLNQVGCFPNPKRPRIFWVGVTGWGARQNQLKNELDDALIPLGWRLEERRFVPHLTFGRVKRGRQTLKNMSFGQIVSPLPLAIDRLHLIESKLQSDGAVYIIRHSAKLGA